MTDLFWKESRIAVSLFQRGDFTLHSGNRALWKIECDALTQEDWETLAFIVSNTYSFKKVEGVPRGGLPFARALEKYAKPDIGAIDLLLVDDVMTTGESMAAHRGNRTNVVGVVVFYRSYQPCPWWIEPIFTLTL